jgi:hypothetical protein
VTPVYVFGIFVHVNVCLLLIFFSQCVFHYFAGSYIYATLNAVAQETIDELVKAIAQKCQYVTDEWYAE